MQATFTDWRAGILADGDSTDLTEFPTEISQILSKAESRRSDLENQKLLEGLQQYFDQHVRKSLEDKTPAHQRLQKLRNELAAYRGDKIPRVMVMSDDSPRKTHVLDRGQYLQPLAEVSFATPECLPPLPDAAPPNRLGLARWLVSPQNPLTARVQVNRMWQYLFRNGYRAVDGGSWCTKRIPGPQRPPGLAGLWNLNTTGGNQKAFIA